MPDITFSTKQFNFTRSGECNRCGQCCISDKCPHFKWVDGVATCLIYDKRDQECEECKIKLGKQGKSFTHKVCINYPDHPFLNCLKTGKCGYSFTKESK
ncbi:MAG: hypothetical protein A2163_07890 [Actinobacteria bacterium RBG_13_35_12]|nr:MAG: hypothetical protein A2163_07890 [Actinobacteria bacterium RBG_13_35_12]